MGEEAQWGTEAAVGSRDWHLTRELAEGTEGRDYERELPGTEAIPEDRSSEWKEDLPSK